MGSLKYPSRPLKGFHDCSREKTDELVLTGESVSRLVQPRELMPSRNDVDAIVSRGIYGDKSSP